jgi:hypothetical protein
MTTFEKVGVGVAVAIVGIVSYYLLSKSGKGGNTKPRTQPEPEPEPERKPEVAPKPVSAPGTDARTTKLETLRKTKLAELKAKAYGKYYRDIFVALVQSLQRLIGLAQVDAGAAQYATWLNDIVSGVRRTLGADYKIAEPAADVSEIVGYMQKVNEYTEAHIDEQLDSLNADIKAYKLSLGHQKPIEALSAIMPRLEAESAKGKPDAAVVSDAAREVKRLLEENGVYVLFGGEPYFGGVRNELWFAQTNDDKLKYPALVTKWRDEYRLLYNGRGLM